MSAILDLTADATAADPACVGCALLGDAPAQPGWLVVQRADGLRVRIDGVRPDSPALAAVRDLDLSAGARAARAGAVARGEAAAGLAAGTAEAVRLRALVTALVSQLNAVRAWVAALKLAFTGAPLVTLLDLQRRVAALPDVPPVDAATVRAAVAAACAQDASPQPAPEPVAPGGG